MAIIPKGQEPESVKKRIDTLFPKLNEAYPNKVIVSLQRDHKKWDETAREISKQLGYESKNEFLIAYGYKIENSVGGRPKTTDGVAVIEALKKRYPNGSPFSTLCELQDANPDLASQFKTLSNQANELFGMTLAKYLKDIGIINKNNAPKDLGNLTSALGVKDNAINNKSNLDPMQSMNEFEQILKDRYIGKKLPQTVEQLKAENEDMSFDNATKWLAEAYDGMSLEQYFKLTNLICKQKRQEKQTCEFSKDEIGIEFMGKNFVHTGLMPEQEIQVKRIVLGRGGFVKSSVSGKTDYLIASTWDTEKYKKAESLIEKGTPIKIISFTEFNNLTQEYDAKTPKKNTFVVDGTTLLRYIGTEKDLVVPEGVTTIEKNAFWGNADIETVQLPNGLEQIDQSAFAGCTGLKSIDILASVCQIGDKAFENCTALENVKLSDGMLTIPEKLFQNCKSLKNVNIGKKPKK